MVFEKQAEAIEPLVYPQCLDDVNSFQRYFFAKLHGCIRKTSRPLAENLILTEKSYAQLRHNKKYRTILHSLFLRYTVLTVGFSLRDPDFLALVGDLREIFGQVAPTIYALMLNPGDDALEEWRQLGIEIMTYQAHSDLPLFFQEMQALGRTRETASSNIAIPLPEAGKIALPNSANQKPIADKDNFTKDGADSTEAQLGHHFAKRINWSFPHLTVIAPSLLLIVIIIPLLLPLCRNGLLQAHDLKIIELAKAIEAKYQRLEYEYNTASNYSDLKEHFDEISEDIDSILKLDRNSGYGRYFRGEIARFQDRARLLPVRPKGCRELPNSTFGDLP
jgi:hypothetical protein